MYGLESYIDSVVRFLFQKFYVVSLSLSLVIFIDDKDLGFNGDDCYPFFRAWLIVSAEQLTMFCKLYWNFKTGLFKSASFHPWLR